MWEVKSCWIPAKTEATFGLKVRGDYDSIYFWQPRRLESDRIDMFEQLPVGGWLLGYSKRVGGGDCSNKYAAHAAGIKMCA